MMITPDVEREALRLWRERELSLPGPGRRMRPDHWDEVTGAWRRCLVVAPFIIEARDFHARVMASSEAHFALDEVVRQLRQLTEQQRVRSPWHLDARATHRMGVPE